MRCGDLLNEVHYSLLSGSLDVSVQAITNDSRKVKEGSLFFCIDGAVVDGHKFASDCYEKGVRVFVVQKEIDVPNDTTVIKVENVNYAMAYISAAFYGYPSKKMKMIGITGTKGKTTTAYMVRSMLSSAGYKVGLIGTIEMIAGDTHIPMSNTTPASIDLQRYLAQMVEAGMDAVVMEVSSQGLMLHRTAGILYDYGVFTNLSPDHIGENEHRDFAHYLQCKAMLFKQCKVGIFNRDDENFQEICKGHTCEVETFGLHMDADTKASDIELYTEKGVLGVSFDVSGKTNCHMMVDVPGKFSVYNSLTAICIAKHFGVEDSVIQDTLHNMKVKGRVEMYPYSEDFTVIIDYAHNEVSLESILTTLKEYKPNRLICVFGCGGNRSKLRRYEMGEVSGELADLTVITSDNPRFEEPKDIMADIEIGMKKTQGTYVMIEDRKEAFRYAMKEATKGDIVVLAGKGHEDYQEIKGVKHHMDERELLAEVKEGR